MSARAGLKLVENHEVDASAQQAPAARGAWERTLPGPGGSLIRYALLESFVAGKRVLDIGCGDGTGSRQLLAWGARKVVGIDPSAEAIACAQRLAIPGELQFQAGEPDQLEALLVDKGPYDIIVSYTEAMPAARLRTLITSIIRRRTPGAMLLASGDLAEATPVPGEPAAPHASAFQTMRELYDSALGTTGQWFVAAPAVGQFVVPVAFWDGVTTSADAEAASRALAMKTVLLPLPIAADGCPPSSWSHYVGIWGGQFAPVAVIGASDMGPTAALDIDPDVERLQRVLRNPKAVLDEEKARGQPTRREVQLEAQLVAMRQRIQYYATRTSTFPYQIGVLEDRVKELERNLFQIERSIGYRVVQAARRLYRVPLLGSALGLARRAVGFAVRTLRSLASR